MCIVDIPIACRHRLNVRQALKRGVYSYLEQESSWLFEGHLIH